MRWRLRETQQLRNSASHASTKWCIWKQQWTCIQELRDGLMFEGQEQRDEFSTKDEDIEYDLLVPKQENLVGKQEWLMSYGTCQLPLRVCVFSWFHWPARHLLVSLTSSLCCSESEDSSDLNSWNHSSNSLCVVTCSFGFTSWFDVLHTVLNSGLVHTLPIEQASLVQQILIFAGSWPLHSRL